MSNPVAKVSTVTGPDGQFREKWVKVWCPGCESLHPFTIEAAPDNVRGDGTPRPTWQWDGNLEAPTFSPSMLSYYSVHICKDEHPPVPCEDYENCSERVHAVLGPENWRDVDPGSRVYGHPTPHTRDPASGNCHSFLRNGVWEFLPDSAHHLAGQSVPMVPLPDWFVKEGEGA